VIPSPATPTADRSSLGRWRGWIILAVLLSGLVVVALLYQRPAHSFDEANNLPAWRTDLAKVLASHAEGCSFGYSVGVTRMAGVGAINRVCVTRHDGRSLLVTFVPVYGSVRLAHAESVALPPGECSQPLGHEWWQLESISPTTLSCPRGFSVDRSP
jgi:hypothetical protein